MKYIKTDKGKLLPVEDSDIELVEVPPRIIVGKKLSRYLKFNDYGKLVAVSDSIPKLCDFFSPEGTFESRDTPPELFKSRTCARLLAEHRKTVVIGYTLVEKNGVKTLEPVAKTNDKGEFELL